MSAPEGRVIGTARLELVPLAVEHAQEMAQVLDDARLHEFIGGTPLDGPAMRARYERLVAGSGDPDVEWLNWVLRSRSDGRLVGTVQATVTGTEPLATAEVAWVVGTRWQGRGFATEAVQALVDALLTDEASVAGRPVAAVIAHVHPDHAASAAVAAAAGLRPTDVIEDGEVRWERWRSPAHR